jgi:hypothetical protein
MVFLKWQLWFCQRAGGCSWRCLLDRFWDIQGVIQLSTGLKLSHPKLAIPKLAKILYTYCLLRKFMQICFFKRSLHPFTQRPGDKTITLQLGSAARLAPCTPRVCWLALPAVLASWHSTPSHHNGRAGHPRRTCRHRCNVTWRSGEVPDASSVF